MAPREKAPHAGDTAHGGSAVRAPRDEPRDAQLAPRGSHCGLRTAGLPVGRRTEVRPRLSWDFLRILLDLDLILILIWLDFDLILIWI